jgi:phage terminase Nu1 subunit (DNA packaging protein)
MALSKADKAAVVSASEARRRKEVALAELREMERDKRRGDLIERAEVRQTWLKVAVQFRDALMRIPTKCAPSVAAAAGDAREVERVLLAEVEGILRTLANDLQAGN